MGKRKGNWVQSVKCWNCNKTGKVPDPRDPSKEMECPVCDKGFIRTKGTISASSSVE